MKRSRCSWVGTSLLSAFLLAGSQLSADDSMRWGVQAGLMVPVESDLTVTAQSGLSLTFGAHVEWNTWKDQTVRARIDFGSFPSGDQKSTTASLDQSMNTKVRNEALGAEYLYRPPSLGGNWSFGAGLYLIRWTVDSTNRLVTSGGTFSPSGSSSWTRQGLGVFAGYRWSRHAETEIRFLSSHYGYENQPARMASLNLLWHF